jgi:CDP-glycerol glycerophosphotransferase (TagB/SpsB family)
MSTIRRILVDGRTPVNYTMFAPMHAAMRGDPRIRFAFIASEEPARGCEIFAGAGRGARVLGRLGAALQPFDAYIASDFMWTRHLKRPCRIQMFHGVGGKYGFDAPTQSMRVWDRLLFVNRRRLRNFVKAGAIDADSPAIRLVGMPKVDCLVDGSINRDAVLREHGLDPARPTVLYAPTWSPASSLNRLGIDLIEAIRRLPVNLVVKLHDRSRNPRHRYSGGVDWVAAITPHLVPARAILAPGSDICPFLSAADVMVTDHSSAGFEYLLLNRPVVRIHVPELIELANIHRDYVELLSEVSESTHEIEDTLAAVERALADPSTRSATRLAVAADLFHEPGTATRRAVEAIYEAVGLEPLRAPIPIAHASAQPSEIVRPCLPSA